MIVSCDHLKSALEALYCLSHTKNNSLRLITYLKNKHHHSRILLYICLVSVSVNIFSFSLCFFLFSWLRMSNILNVLNILGSSYF